MPRVVLLTLLFIYLNAPWRHDNMSQRGMRWGALRVCRDNDCRDFDPAVSTPRIVDATWRCVTAASCSVDAMWRCVTAAASKRRRGDAPCASAVKRAATLRDAGYISPALHYWCPARVLLPATGGYVIMSVGVTEGRCDHDNARMIMTLIMTPIAMKHCKRSQ